MKDKLIELLHEIANMQLLGKSIEEGADFLISEGVIVPPCKVGDRIYTIHPLNYFACEAVVKAIYFTEDKKYYPKPHLIIQYDMHRGRSRVNFTEIGKTAFFTREEAEKALGGKKGS